MIIIIIIIIVLIIMIIITITIISGKQQLYKTCFTYKTFILKKAQYKF